MTVFSPEALTALPRTVTDYMTASADAPAALVSMSDGIRQVTLASGTADLATGAPALADASFEIGSQTKMMTAVVILQLAEEGLLDLDRPLADYLPAALIDGVANADIATVGQALAMRGGIPNYTEVTLPDGSTYADMLAVALASGETVTLEQQLGLLDGQPATFAPGEGYAYSNTAYALLGRVAEAATGQDLGALFAARIFVPLGMTHSFLNDFRADPARLHSYADYGGARLDVTGLHLMSEGEGGVISTTGDMVRFLSALLVEQSLLSSEALAVMTDLSAGSEEAEGILAANGLVVVPVAGLGTFVGFSGGTAGTQTATFLHMETGRIFSTALTQSDLPANALEVVLSLAEFAAQDDGWTVSAAWDGALRVEGVSAAALEIGREDGAVIFGAEGAEMRFDIALRHLGTGDLSFTDGSILSLGTAAGDRGVIGRDSAAWLADNRMLGFTGADRLFGGAGDDRLEGHRGRDMLRGALGDDRLD
ncbi:MAG: serine hydrolase, partial [Pseudodonghicola sp.]